ncbi:MAG: serine/threonine-protein kinase [Verrucomicrobiota bacterium]
MQNEPTIKLEFPMPAGGDGSQLVGQQIGSYRLTRQLTSGGMGWVYEAVSDKWPRPLVVKVPAGGRLASLEIRKRFLQEVHAVKSLSHSGIVGVLDDGEEDGILYMVMPLVEGKTLEQWVSAVEPNNGLRLAKFSELCAIVAAVHREGKIHRDLKPANIMIDKHGTIRLLDFGIARSFESERMMTHTGMALGTPLCMAPEQTTHTIAIGPQADVYALGVILYWLLTGRYPIEVSGLTPDEAFWAIQKVRPTAPASLNPTIPAAVDAIVRRCLEKEPAFRPSDGDGLGSQLAAALDEARAVPEAWLQTNFVPAESSGLKARELKNDTAVMIEVAGGAVSLKSPYYVERRGDRDLLEALVKAESIVLIQGPRQIGKTSLLARGLEAARKSGRSAVSVDFQSCNDEVIASLKSLYLHLAAEITDQLVLPSSCELNWDERRSANTNFERFLSRKVLAGKSGPLVWAMDEVDRLFTRPYCNELFGMLRSWHNARSLDPAGPWAKLSLVMTYATEASLFITDPNQSPFNIGVRVILEDFSMDHLADLNRRHQEPLTSNKELERFHSLVGGHPYLIRAGLNFLVREHVRIADLEKMAIAERGPFFDHLHRAGAMVSREPSLMLTLKALLKKEPCPTAADYYRLRSAGLVNGESPETTQLRCNLYEKFFAELLGADAEG